MKGWKLFIRKFKPNPNLAPEKKTLGQRFARTLDLIELKGLRAGFKGEVNFLGGGIKLEKMKLNAESMVRIANALQNSGPQQKKRFANDFVMRHFSNYFAESFPRQQAVLECLITPHKETSTTTVANAFPDTEIAINSLQVIMKEAERIIGDIKAARPYSPPTREYSAGLVADLFSNALTYPITRIDSTINELRKLKNAR